MKEIVEVFEGIENKATKVEGSEGSKLGSKENPTA